MINDQNSHLKLFFCCCFIIIQAVTTDLINSCTNEQIGYSYLRKYGYITKDGSSGDDPDATSEAIKEFQRFFDLPQTGIFDSTTILKMKQPRSGNVGCLSDPGNGTSNDCNSVPQKNYYTYSIMKYSKILKNEDVVEIIQKAFSSDSWCLEPLVCFNGMNLNENADIKIYFERGPANDFDGKWDSCSGSGTTVSYTNRVSGEIYFDDHENWSLNSSKNGVDLLSVAIHEIGYAIGLSQSNDTTSSMYPIFDAPRSRSDADINLVGNLYSKLPEALKVNCRCDGTDITDIPGRPNKPDGVCTGKCAEELEESLNDRG